MKERDTYIKEIYQKYEEEKQKGEKSGIFSLLKEKRKNISFMKIACMFCIATVATVGIVYASIVTYQKSSKVWKDPKIYNTKEDNKITEEEKKKLISEEEAKKVASDFLEKMGFSNIVFEKAELYKSESLNQTHWDMKTTNKLAISIDAYDKKLWSLRNDTIDDSKVKSKLDIKLAEEVAKEIYRKLGYQEGEYQLTYLQKYAVGAAWYADFSKLYDGVQNPYQVVRISFIPETKEIWHLVLFDEEFENNPVTIEKEEAIEIAKEKYNVLSQKVTYIKDKIESCDAKLSIEKMNSFVYGIENSLDAGEAYSMPTVIRKVWKVEINQGEVFICVDCTTGEIIGGDMRK